MLTFCTFLIVIGQDDQDKRKPYAYISIVMNLILLILEILVMIKGPMLYFSQVNNILDLFQHASIPALSLILINNWIEEKDNVDLNLRISVTLMVSGVRIVFSFRIFDSVRSLVGIILQAVLDLFGFMIITTAIVFIFAVIHLNMDHHLVRTGEDYTGSLFWRSFWITYEYLHGNWDGPVESEYNNAQYNIHFFFSIFLTIILTNIGIAIVSQTFADAVEIKELVDFREMLSIMLEFGDLVSYFTPRKKEGGDDGDPSGGNYICFVVKKEEE